MRFCTDLDLNVFKKGRNTSCLPEIQNGATINIKKSLYVDGVHTKGGGRIKSLIEKFEKGNHVYIVKCLLVLLVSLFLVCYFW